MSKNDRTLSNGKLLLAAIASPILLLVFSTTPNGVSINVCSGFLALMTIIFWVLVYARAAEMVRTITGTTPRRHRLTALEPTPTPPPVVEPHDDSRSIFL